MTREDYNNKEFEEVMEQLDEERDDITTYDKDGMQRRYTSKHELNKYDLIEAIIKQK